eukprot:TRINITY_DN3426_c0_g1_i1.p1 TRINITY_DN3426_c0_g1~~TRINITY_DN3426_c0_g1_i1.p1  ORF type:complete len:568 (+),score=89.63 TRINITY_DN3426_c0_g1_i1:80-1705(+)
MALASLPRTQRTSLLRLSRAFSAASGCEATISRTSKLFIDNKYLDAEGGKTLGVVSPTDGKTFAHIAHASPADVDRAVASARACFDKTNWAAPSSLSERTAVLRKVASALRSPEKLAEIATIETMDCGKPLTESEADIGYCADIFDFYADIAEEHLAPTKLDIPPQETPQPEFSAHIAKEPQGVVGCVSPWNFPLQQAVLKVAPALAVGCTVVVKPSPFASLTTCALGEMMVAAGAPPGAMNVVTGGPPEEIDSTSTGQHLIDHPDIDKLSFTGSGVAGRKMLQASSQRLRPTSLELGGKSAFLIFDDAHPYLDAVVDWILLGIFLCQGQVCTATSRLLVHRSLEPVLMKKLLEATDKIKVGDPMDRSIQMGPMVSASQRDKTVSMLSKAEAEGCQIHRAPLSLPDSLKEGFYLSPTIVSGLAESNTAWKEEIFGPVLSVRTFDTEDEAIAAANNTAYGLANAVYSADMDRCARVASKLKSGVVWQNCSQPLFVTTPMGGYIGKESGFGHEMGVAGLTDYINHKTVVSTLPGHHWNWYGFS